SSEEGLLCLLARRANTIGRRGVGSAPAVSAGNIRVSDRVQRGGSRGDRSPEIARVLVWRLRSMRAQSAPRRESQDARIRAGEQRQPGDAAEPEYRHGERTADEQRPEREDHDEARRQQAALLGRERDKAGAVV